MANFCNSLQTEKKTEQPIYLQNLQPI